MRFLYTVAIRAYTFMIRMVSFLHPKARLWIRGRRQWRHHYTQATAQWGQAKVLWMHVSSLGEFEQGRPVMEAFRRQFPEWKILLTFFSPSGYEIRKNYPGADFTAYLPADTPANARDFLMIVKPSAAIFVKYDFWANYLVTLKRFAVPTLLISALFRPGQPFFQWYGGLWRQMLGCFSHIFVQTPAAEKLLKRVDFHRVSVAGDTRIDRVLQLAAEAKDNDIAAAFTRHWQMPTLVAGSVWDADLDMLLPAWQASTLARGRMIIALHDPRADMVERLEKRLDHMGISHIRYSQSAVPAKPTQALLIDNVGLLNTLYRYGTLAYIGGGFGKGIHNTLEPAAYALPVITGPRIQKFEEAIQMKNRGGLITVSNTAEALAALNKLDEMPARETAAKAVDAWLQENKGATDKILAFLEQVSGKKWAI